MQNIVKMTPAPVDLTSYAANGHRHISQLFNLLGSATNAARFCHDDEIDTVVFNLDEMELKLGALEDCIENLDEHLKQINSESRLYLDIIGLLISKSETTLVKTEYSQEIVDWCHARDISYLQVQEALGETKPYSNRAVRNVVLINLNQQQLVHFKLCWAEQIIE